MLDDLVVRYGPRLVLDGLGLVAGAGERLGVVGENGSGKSTLLRVLAGVVQPEHGVVRVHGDVGLLAQQVDAAGGRTVADLLAEARREIDDLQGRREALEAAIGDRPDDVALLEEYGEVLEALEQHEAWTVGSRLDAAVDGLGLASLDRTRPLATLSGGQRHRLALAALLVRHPAVLLLDEPTTHLDDDAVAFLEARLREWSGVVVMVSHDRVLLDAVATSVLDLDPSLDGRATRSSGGYTAYLDAKAAARERWQLAYRDWQDEHDRLVVLARGSGQRIGHDNRSPRDNDKYAPHFFGNRVDAAVSRRVKDAQQRLADLDRNKVMKPPAPLRFSSSFARRDGDSVLLQVRDLHVPGRVDLDALDVTAATRLLVEGPNGSGKSSLLSALVGRAGARAGLGAAGTWHPGGAARPAHRLAGPVAQRPQRVRRRQGRARSTTTWPTCSTSASCTRASCARRWARCPWASSAGWRWRGSWSTTRTCCCWTSRPTTSRSRSSRSSSRRSGVARARSWW